MSKLKSNIHTPAKVTAEYPCLMIGTTSNRVAIFASPTVGIYIAGSNLLGMEVGDAVSLFKPFTGSITLTQE